MARGKGAAAQAAPAKKAAQRNAPGLIFRLFVGILAGLAVLTIGSVWSVWLAGNPRSAGRIDPDIVPSVVLAAAVYVLVLALRWRMTMPTYILAMVAAVVSAALLVNNGGQPALGRAMTQAGGMLHSTSCDPPPTGKARATSPAGRTCVAVPKCTASRVPQWSAADKPTGRCVSVRGGA